MTEMMLKLITWSCLVHHGIFSPPVPAKKPSIWSLEVTGDVDSETEILEVYTLLTENYVEDDVPVMISGASGLLVLAGCFGLSVSQLLRTACSALTTPRIFCDGRSNHQST